MAARDRIVRLARPVAVTAATAAWVIGAVVNDLQGLALGASLAGGAVLTVLAVGLPMIAERRARDRAASAEQVAEDAAARMQLVLDDALEPLAYLIGRIADRAGRRRDVRELQGQATVVVLAASAEVLGAQRLRACLFTLDGPNRLVPTAFHGRAEAPRTVFTRGTPLGDYALELLARRDDLFCPDVTADPPPGWQPGGHQYRTFLAVPVATEQRAFGVMTIDGLHVGDLTPDDLSAARVFARLLAVALAA
jgi:GAF domain